MKRRIMRTIEWIVVCAGALFLGTALQNAFAQESDNPAYLNPQLSPEQRYAVTKEDAEGVARDVFSRPMALTVIGPFEGDAFDEDAAEGIFPNGSSLEAAAHAEGRP